MEPKGKKLPKWFWPVGIGVAILIGLYLRNRSSQQPASSQQSQTPTDVTSNPYFYTPSGAYVNPYDTYGSSPYGMGSLTSNLGLPSGFDPTSFEEGISYAQQQLGTSPNITTPTDSQGAAAVAAPVGNAGSPATINLTIAPTYGTRTSGKPSTSGRNHRLSHHKPKAKKKVKR